MGPAGWLTGNAVWLFFDELGGHQVAVRRSRIERIEGITSHQRQQLARRDQFDRDIVDMHHGCLRHAVNQGGAVAVRQDHLVAMVQRPEKLEMGIPVTGNDRIVLPLATGELCISAPGRRS